MNQYWTYDPETLIVSPEPVTAQVVMGQTIIPTTALTVKPVAGQSDCQVIVELGDDGLPTGTVLIADYRGQTVYDLTDCTHSKEISELGPVPDGYTLKEPITDYDVWANGRWNTDIGAQYIAQYNAVDSTRRSLYAKTVDPLESEAARLTRTGDTDGAKSLYSRIDEWVKKLKQRTLGQHCL
ncbi:hypothetical protein P4S72_27105 [Vibrio sp. PP-XX7]